MFKHNPLSFHKAAMPAANAAECAREQGKFWEMQDMLFANNKKLTDPDLESYANKLGLNEKVWKDCFTANKYKSRIKADQKTAVSLGAGGTPAFFINGRFLSGARPFDQFKEVIDAELKKAKASGVSKRDYYQKEIVAKGQKKP